ncbi:MAG TPA: methylornithine synthase PylB [Clostridia bacterium]|nr:methylornithine synthase PylB [Clostridia bacterium]
MRNVLNKALDEEPLCREEICSLLSIRHKEDLGALFETARILRTRYFGDEVFLYGFVYFSTYCRNSCAFCLYRSPNDVVKRYRKPDEEVVSTAVELAESGVHLVDLTMGEDMFYLRPGDGPLLPDLISKVKSSTGLPLMVSPGVVSDDILIRLKNAGADWYACYQETHNRELFSKLRQNQDYDLRFGRKVFAKKIGFLIEEGILAGVGETVEDVADSIEAMKALGAHQVRVMTFVPQPGTPMSTWPRVAGLRELIITAVFRLVFPDKLVVGSLDVEGLPGLESRLMAGANVVTSIIPPRKGLMGVSQSTLGVDEGLRTVAAVKTVLQELGLKVASHKRYRDWMNRVNVMQEFSYNPR